MALLRGTGLRTAREHVVEAELLLRTLEGNYAAVGMSPEEIQGYSILRAIGEVHEMCRAKQGWHLSGVEGEAHRLLAKRYGDLPHVASFYVPAVIQHRDLTKATASAGGYLVGASNGGSFIDQLRNRSVAFRLGAQRLPGQREDLLLPRQAGAATAIWLSSEGAEATESQQTLQQVGSSAKTVGAYTEISRRLTKQSNPAAEQLVTTDLAAVTALALDAAVINGSGAAGQPMGILNAANVGTFTGTNLGLDALSTAQQDVLDANAMLNPATLGYATTPAISKLLKGRPRFSGNDTPLWQGALHDGTIESVRAVSSKQIPAATMIYGDWSQVLVPEWGVLVIELNPYANFQAGIIGVRALWSCDVVIRHAESFRVATSID